MLSDMKGKLKRFFVGLMLFVLVLFTTLLYINTGGNVKGRAILSMAWGLIIFWICIGGFLMYHFREKVRSFVLRQSGSWQKKFILFAILLALLEEAVTVIMTNLAPLFGSKIGEAYITASTNYFDVVLFHSVIVFVPLFFSTTALLKRYQFSPFAIFIFFGIVGTIAEALYSGNLSQLATFYQWVFVYGLMVYLPAYSIPTERGAVVPKWWHYLIAVPFILLRALPAIIILGVLIVGVLHHPNVHF
jgi:hypothetical protein